MKKRLSLTLALLLTLCLLAGCGAQSKGTASMDISANGSAEIAPEEGLLTEDKAESSSTTLPENQKMVRKIWINTETEDLTTLLTSIEQKTADLSGYVESQNQYNGSKYSGSKRYRNASLTLRIPTEHLDAFISQVADVSNVVSKKQTAENITLTYVATESRIKALETEQTRLMELLAKAENMTDLLSIEKRLTQVQSELEQVASQLRVYDNMVDYGTVYLEIQEVTEFTVVEEPSTIWERIGTGFMESLKGIGNFFIEMFVFLVVGLPYLVPLGLLITGAIFLLRRRRKKKMNKKDPA